MNIDEGRHYNKHPPTQNQSLLVSYKAMNLVKIDSIDIVVDINTGDVYPFIENYKHFAGQCVIANICDLPDTFFDKLSSDDIDKVIEIGEAVLDNMREEIFNGAK